MEQSLSDIFIEKLRKSILLRILLVLLGFSFGFFGFILPKWDHVPVSREEAETYTGYFEKYEHETNYRYLYFQDGSEYGLYPHTEPQALSSFLESMEPGTKLYLTIHPKSCYVIEIRTETEELLNFETSQAENYKYQNGYIWIGVFLCLVPFAVIALIIVWNKAEEKESARQKKQRTKVASGMYGIDTPTIRTAASAKKERILLKVDISGYEIVYRRIKTVNELIVNGVVYDEKKALIEVNHTLIAVIDDHTIEAGLHDDCMSFIRFDGKTIAEKKRVI